MSRAVAVVNLVIAAVWSVNWALHGGGYKLGLAILYVGIAVMFAIPDPVER